MLQGVAPIGVLHLTRVAVDAVADATRSPAPAEAFPSTVPILAALAALFVVSDLLRSTGEWVRTAHAELVQDLVRLQLQKKCAEADLSLFETPARVDRLYRAIGEDCARPTGVLENLGGAVEGLVVLAGIGITLTHYAVWLPAALLLGCVPAVGIILRASARNHDWWARNTAGRRLAEYYMWLLTHPDNAQEVRLFGLGDHFRRAFSDVRRRLRRERTVLLRNQGLAKSAAALVSLAVSGSVSYWMLWRLFNGAASFGDLALFYQAFSVGQSVLRGLLGYLGQVHTHSLALGNLFELLDSRPRVTDPEAPLPAALEEGPSLEFRDVTFSYPGSDRPALSHFDLAVPAGKIVAVVGPNGAGKSTLVKLLCRFYDPEAGEVRVNGQGLHRFRLDDLRQQISVLFQQPVRYQMTVRESIALGDVSGAQREDVIQAAAVAAGADDLIRRLPDGYDTHLGKYIKEGCELSGGEWQRIALARAFLRDSPIVLLDEPTSAMDSWAEAAWFERVRELAAGRTVLIITHRFTIARRADLIHVLAEGRVVESGTHLELLGQGGLYSQSWHEQTSLLSEMPAMLESDPRVHGLADAGGPIERAVPASCTGQLAGAPQ